MNKYLLWVWFYFSSAAVGYHYLFPFRKLIVFRVLEALLKKQSREKMHQNFKRGKKRVEKFAEVLWFSAQPHEPMFLQKKKKKKLLSLKQFFEILKQLESFTVYKE